MAERVFLGWDKPFLGSLVEWLMARREELPGLLVVVPTAQAGRRLREALAETAEAVLAPKVVTPGHFLKTEEAAPDAVELLAWVEVLESIRDWSPYEAVFPLPPGEGESPGWALGLAKSLAGLRTSLQENAMMLSDAARKMAITPEPERWDALARLEAKVEQQLDRWQWRSRSRLLSRVGYRRLPKTCASELIVTVPCQRRVVEMKNPQISSGSPPARQRPAASTTGGARCHRSNNRSSG